MMNDTFQFVKDLQAAGFTREQAEAIVSLRYRNPSMFLAGLQETDLTRRQAEAILDYIWVQTSPSSREAQNWPALSLAPVSHS